MTVQSFHQRSFSKNYHVIVLGHDVKQMEPQKDTTDQEEEEEEEIEDWKRVKSFIKIEMCNVNFTSQ